MWLEGYSKVKSIGAYVDLPTQYFMPVTENINLLVSGRPGVLV